MAFDVLWRAAAKRALQRQPSKIGHAVVEFVYGPLADNPFRVGKPLGLEFAGLHSARRGDFRVLYRIDRERERVEIVEFQHRSDAYRRR